MTSAQTPTSPHSQIAPATVGSRRKRQLLGVSAAILAAFLAFAGWFVLRGAPAEVSIEGAVGQIDGADDVDVSGATIDPEGSWQVDSSVGTFSVADTTGNFVGFRIVEELASVGVNEAVGRTPDVVGAITIDGTTLVAADFSADMTTIVSDVSRRESAIQTALNTTDHVFATFSLTEAVELGDATSGEDLSVVVSGELMINGVTRRVAIPIVAQLVSDTIALTSSFDVVFADFDIDVPSSQAVVSVEEHGSVEVQLFFTKA